MKEKIKNILFQHKNKEITSEQARNKILNLFGVSDSNSLELVDSTIYELADCIILIQEKE